MLTNLLKHGGHHFSLRPVGARLCSQTVDVKPHNPHEKFDGLVTNPIQKVSPGVNAIVDIAVQVPTAIKLSYAVDDYDNGGIRNHIQYHPNNIKAPEIDIKANFTNEWFN